MLKRTRKAFTLLELVVAIVVLGILAALAVPAFTQVITNSKKSTATESALSISRDAVAIAATSGGPASSADVNTAITESTNTPVSVSSNLTTVTGQPNVVKYSVVNGSSSTTVCVTIPAIINATPTYYGSTC